MAISNLVKYRLQLTEPDLLKMLLPETEDRLRKVGLAVCTFALQRSGLDSPLIAEAMTFLERGQPVPRRIRTDLQDLVDQLDEIYFDLKEADQEDQVWHPAFHEARAAAAVLFACEEDPLFAAAEAADEARVAAHDDVDGLKKVIKAALT